MYYRHMELTLLSLAKRIGLQPSTLARLCSVTSNLSKKVPSGPLNSLEDCYLHLTVITLDLSVLKRDIKLVA
jgi:hypothetical protein